MGIIDHKRLTPAQKRAIERIREAGGYVPFIGQGASQAPYMITQRTVEALIEHGILETVEDEDELRIEGVRFTTDAHIRYISRWR